MRALLLIQSPDDLALAEAAESGADALILDLGAGESDRASAGKMTAKALLKLRLAAPLVPAYARIARVAEADAELDAIMPVRPAGILLGDVGTGADLQQLSVKLSVREASFGFADGATKIIATVAGSPASVFELSSLAGKTQRLTGLIFGADDLARALGGSSEAAPVACVRNLMLLAARAAGVVAIDAAAPRDIDGAHLRELCAAAKRDGFEGKVAADRAQLAIIHSMFKKDQEPNR
ncbi:MAG TPA: aldolase/citrate lyase family protein [Methylovirgula sp.]|nr:aldolase/citrate lyase family protein [Methylovirgula sp.]